MKVNQENLTVKNAGEINVSDIVLPVDYPEPPTLDQILSNTDWKAWLVNAGFVESGGKFIKDGKEVVLKHEEGSRIGDLIDHGPAKYKFDDAEKASYFVRYRDAAGTEQIAWGQDLQRAIAGFKASDKIKLEIAGKDGKRNVWTVSDASKPLIYYSDGRPADPCDLIAQGQDRADAMALVQAYREATPDALDRASAIKAAMAEREQRQQSDARPVTTLHDVAAALAAGQAVGLSDKDVEEAVRRKLARPTAKGLTLDHFDNTGAVIGQTTITKSGRIETVCNDDTPAQIPGDTKSVIIVETAAQALTLRLAQLKNKAKLGHRSAMPTILIGGKKAAESALGKAILSKADPAQVQVLHDKSRPKYDIEFTANEEKKVKAQALELDFSSGVEGLQSSLKGIHDPFILAICALGATTATEVSQVIKDGVQATMQRLESAVDASATAVTALFERVKQDIADVTYDFRDPLKAEPTSVEQDQEHAGPSI